MNKYEECGNNITTRKIEDQIADAKSKWDEAIGIESELTNHGFYIFRSPTGFPLATMHLSSDANKKPSIGNSPMLQQEWFDNRPQLTDKRVNDEALPAVETKGV